MGACDNYSCYCSVDDVLNATGMDRARVIELSDRHSSNDDVNDLIEEYIADATQEIRDRLHINTTIRKELHLGTGEDDIFSLGTEDQIGYYQDVADRLVDVINVYLGGDTACFRKLRPYPTDCELGTEGDILLWADSTAADTANTTTFVAGTNSIQLVYANVAQFGRYPNIAGDNWIDKNIDIFEFMAFYVRSTVDNTTITVRIYDGDGNYDYATYEIVKKNHWYLVMLDLDEDFTTSIAWDDIPLMYIDFFVDRACTLLIDNMNFNDEWMFTAPAGEVAIMRRLSDEPLSGNYPFYVTYRYDPYYDTDTMVPRNINKATKNLAGVDLVDFMSGVRQTDTEFDVQSESGVPNPSKDALASTRSRLLKKYEEAIKSIGFGWEFIPVRGC